MSEDSARRGPARMSKSSSTGLGTRGRCKASSGARGCSSRPEAFPRFVVGYLQEKTFVGRGEVLQTRSLRQLS
ncbi:hypothetical protein B296_00052178 [Ensete ventricosum]|uniref:Uncharacterized protein n=1 Tax=Ensete ventricosum TaxID=4639 RepID=A0A426YDB0_ENSVE|nr:hypothetical protein B296_00052178 [Ensete ventricosum]